MFDDLSKWQGRGCIFFVVLCLVHIARYTIILVSYSDIEVDEVETLENYVTLVSEEW
jgi:hypothetical protein